MVYQKTRLLINHLIFDRLDFVVVSLVIACVLVVRLFENQNGRALTVQALPLAVFRICIHLSAVTRQARFGSPLVTCFAIGGSVFEKLFLACTKTSLVKQLL